MTLATKANSMEGIPSVPKTDERAKESLPESFDALAAYLNEKFAKLMAGVEQMREELHGAEEQSERLRHELLDGTPWPSLSSSDSSIHTGERPSDPQSVDPFPASEPLRHVGSQLDRRSKSGGK